MREKKIIFYTVFLVILHVILIKLFVSMEYFAYFAFVFLLVYVIKKYQLIIKLQNMFFFTLYTIFLYSLIFFYEECLFQFFLNINIENILAFGYTKILYTLYLIHLLILFLLSYNSQRQI